MGYPRRSCCRKLRNKGSEEENGGGDLAMTNFTYRLADIADTPLLLEIQMRWMLEDFAWDEKMQKKFRDGYGESIPRLMGEEVQFFYLAFLGERLAGVGKMYIWGEEIMPGQATVPMIYVLPEFRGQGLLLELLFRLVEVARERGCDRMQTCVRKGNRRHLHSLGFQDVWDYLEDEEKFGLSDELKMPLL